MVSRSGGKEWLAYEKCVSSENKENAHINNSNGRWPVYPLSGRTSTCHSTGLLRRRRWLRVSIFFFSSEIVHRAPGWVATKITLPTIDHCSEVSREINKNLRPSQLLRPSFVIHPWVIYHDFGDNNYPTRHRYYHTVNT